MGLAGQAKKCLACPLRVPCMGNGLADHRNPPRAIQLRSMLRGEGVKGNGRMDQLLLFQGFINSCVGVLHMIRVFQGSTALVPITRTQNRKDRFSRRRSGSRVTTTTEFRLGIPRTLNFDDLHPSISNAKDGDDPSTDVCTPSSYRPDW